MRRSGECGRTALHHCAPSIRPLPISRPTPRAAAATPPASPSRGGPAGIDIASSHVALAQGRVSRARAMAVGEEAGASLNSDTSIPLAKLASGWFAVKVISINHPGDEVMKVSQLQ